MNFRRVVLASLVVLALPLAARAAAPAAPAPATSAAPAQLKSVTLHIFNRVFPDFHDKVEAVPNKEFRVGDSEYTAKIVRFVPDFDMDIKAHKVVSRSGEPRNPAFRIAVKKNGASIDTSWAFFNLPPHFGPRNVLAFVATNITFTNRPAMASKDSLAIKIQQHEGATH